MIVKGCNITKRQAIQNHNGCIHSLAKQAKQTKISYQNLIKSLYIIINILKIQGRKSMSNTTRSKIQTVRKYTEKSAVSSISYYKKNK